jgi:TolB-like protein
VAVADLQAQGVSSSDAAVIADLLRNDLVATGLQVIEKSNMDKVLAEQTFQQTGCTTQECAVKLGKLLNVQRMVVGSFGKLMDKYFVSLRLVDVESGGVIFADSANGRQIAEIESGVKDLAARIARQASFGLAPRAEAPRPAAVEPSALAIPVPPPAIPAAEPASTPESYDFAVANLDSSNMLPDEVAQVAEILRLEIGQVTGRPVMSREEMERALAEHNLPLGGCASDECAKPIGHNLKARKVVFGSLSRDSEAFYLSIFILTSGTGESSYGGAARGATLSDLAADTRVLVGKIRGRL